MKNNVTKFIAELYKPMIDDIKRQYYAIVEGNKLNKEEKALNKAIKEAVKRSKATGKTHYVLMDWAGNPYTANKFELNVMYKAGLFKRELSIYDLMKEALFIARGVNGVVKK